MIGRKLHITRADFFLGTYSNLFFFFEKSCIGGGVQVLDIGNVPRFIEMAYFYYFEHYMYVGSFSDPLPAAAPDWENQIERGYFIV